MTEAARVRSVGVLDELRLALQFFADQAGVALDAVDGEIRRTAQWLEHQQQFWGAEIRRSEDDVFMAKQELGRKKMMKMGDRPVDTWEEEKALRQAKARLEHAQDKQERVRHWLRAWSSEMLDYEGPARQLKGFLEGDILRACALLRDKAQSLEAYLAIASPGGGSRPPVAQPTGGVSAPAKTPDGDKPSLAEPLRSPAAKEKPA